MERVQLKTPRWHGTSYLDGNSQEADWASVGAAIRALDGVALQEVYLSPEAGDPDTWLCVAGRQGSYLLTGSRGGTTFPTYVDLSRSPEPPVELSVGGQEGLYPANWIVRLETALAIAESFFVAGGFECGVKWQDA